MRVFGGIILICCLGFTGHTQTKKSGNRILIIGNSIVQHDPSPAIGWSGNWGMAASVADSDFVHVLARKFREVNTGAIIEWKNIAVFERQFKNYDLTLLKHYQDFNADMIIVKLSENVNDSSAVSGEFKTHYKDLLNYLDPRKKAVRILVDGFWPKRNVNRLVKEIAMEGNYPFVSITDLFNDESNTAKGKFEHEGVARHPSDKGMRLIAEKIFETARPLINK